MNARSHTRYFVPGTIDTVPEWELTELGPYVGHTTHREEMPSAPRKPRERGGDESVWAHVPRGLARTRTMPPRERVLRGMPLHPRRDGQMLHRQPQHLLVL